MNILVLDCAISRLCVAVKTDDKMVSEIFDIGMRQSEILVPAIDEVLQKCEISAKEINYSAITIGPGSFTGLRLGISALKSLEFAYNIPIYPISTLKMYSFAYEDFNIPVLSCIDANKDKFYASITFNDQIILPENDWEIEKIIETVKSHKTFLEHNQIIISGPENDRQKISLLIQEKNPSIKVLTPKINIFTTDSLFKITQKMIEEKAETLKEYEGPVYLRASEAELKLKKN